MLPRKLRWCWIVQACQGSIDVKRLDDRRHIITGMGFCLLFPNFWVFDGSGDHFRETSKFVENSWGVYICVRGKFSPPKGAAIPPRLGIVVHRVDYHKRVASLACRRSLRHQMPWLNLDTRAGKPKCICTSSVG